MAIIWRTFEIVIGKNFYAHGDKSPKGRIVELFHAGTSTKPKQHIQQEMGKKVSNLRILICTIAFGMVVNCSSVNRIIHFGAPKSMESYLQECDRAGRDGAQSKCFLLYNGMLLANCNEDIKASVYTAQCRRISLLSAFPATNNSGCQKIYWLFLL